MNLEPSDEHSTTGKKTSAFFSYFEKEVIDSWYFLFPLVIVFFHALGTDSPYRTLAYLNIPIVLFLWFRKERVHRPLADRHVAKVLFFPIFLIALHLFSDWSSCNAKEIRHILSALFVGLGTWKLVGTRDINEKPGERILVVVASVIAIYALIQGIAVFLLKSPYGSTKNPHYLAQYCMLLLPIACYAFLYSPKAIRTAIAGTIIILAALLLLTSSRPAWLSLFAASLVFAWFQRTRRLWVPVAILFCIVVLYFSDAAGFGSRISELVSRIAAEERVYIWQDTWRMQLQSSPIEVLIGHGLDSFKKDFQEFSSYGKQGIDFNAPHNYLLELLYTSGILGLSAVTCMLYFLYRKLHMLYGVLARSPFILTLIVVLTAHLLFGSITIPFFSSYNLLVLGLISGLTLLQEEYIANAI
jgi:hypothetical protein